MPLECYAAWDSHLSSNRVTPDFEVVYHNCNIRSETISIIANTSYMGNRKPHLPCGDKKC